MQKKKTHLQRHRMKAFTATLCQVEIELQKNLDFTTGYADVYKLPPALVKNNVRRYKNWLKAIEQLKSLEMKHIK